MRRESVRSPSACLEKRPSDASELSRFVVNLAAGAVLLVSVFVIYGPCLNGALLWDDPAHVTRLELRSWTGLWRIWFEPGATQQYYPVLHSAFWLQHRLWGDTTMGYHVVSVLLHALNACGVAVLLQRLSNAATVSDRQDANSGTPRRVLAISWFAGFLFAVHPVAVESVAWITEQKNTLSMAFYLGAALAYFRFDAARTASSYIVATLLFVLAVGSKTTTATLPAALWVVLWWIRGRLQWKRDVLPLLPWIVIAIPAGLVTASIEKTMIGAELVVPDLSLIERTLLAARVLWFYLGKLLWPAELTFFYPLWDVAAEASGWIGYLLAAIGVTAGFWLVRRRSRAPLALWLLYAGTLFPALGFFKVFPFQFSYVADHFQYLAMPAALTGIALGLAWSAARWGGKFRTLLPIGTTLLLLGLAIKSHAESRLYVSDEVLFRANITENPGSWMGYHILAQRIGKTPERRAEAIALFLKALELNPGSAETRAAYAGLLVREPGHSHEAIPLFEEAIRIRPTYAEAHNALANELFAIPGRMSEAIEHYQTAIKLRPDFVLAEANLAMALAQIPGREDEALTHFERALGTMPDYAPAHFYLARLLARMPDRLNDAVRHYETALALRGGSRDALFELGDILLRLGRTTEAARRVDELLRFSPDDVEALNLRGVIFAQEGRIDRARAAWRRALERAPDYEPARRNLLRTQ